MSIGTGRGLRAIAALSWFTYTYRNAEQVRVLSGIPVVQRHERLSGSRPRTTAHHHIHEMQALRRERSWSPSLR